MKAVCPSCGCVFQAQGRAKIGMGTQKARPLSHLNRNHVQLIFVVMKNSDKKLTAHEIQRLINHGMNDGQPLMYLGKGNKESYWNYHLIQSNLSVLVGSDFLSMTVPKSESWNWDLTRFETSPVPEYYISLDQKKRFSDLLRSQMNVIVTEPSYIR